MDYNLSVIIPAKNEEQFIGQCLEALHVSLNNTDLRSYEVILVDNGSQDDTKDIAAEYGCSIINEPVGNISKLRNIGAKNAKGTIVAFLDADCLVNPLWARYCLQQLSNDKIGIVGTRAVPDLSNATWVERCLFVLFCGSAKRSDFVNWLGSSNIFIRKNVFFEVSGFNKELKTAEDVALCTAARSLGYKIFLEKRIDTIHLRESKTLTELFRREFWRGSSSISSLIKNNFPSDELLSVIVPAIFFAALTGGLILVFSYPKLGLAMLLLNLFMAFSLVLKKVNIRDLPIFNFTQCLVIAFVYLLARSIAFFRECFVLVFRGNRLHDGTARKLPNK